MTSRSKLMAAVASLGIGVGMMGLTAPAAFASTGGTSSSGVEADVTGGALSITAPPLLTFAVTLNGGNESTVQSERQAVSVNDDTGTGAGWHVTVISTALETSATTPVVVPSSWTVTLNGSTSSATATTAPAVFNNGGGTNTAPSGNTATYPLTIPGVHGASSPTPAVVYTAAAGSGMGNFDINADFWQNIPADALAGGYRSTLTWSVVAGP